MPESRVVTCVVRREARDLYELIWRPACLSRWASGLAAGLEPDGDGWCGQGPEGPVRITFTPHNPDGVLDHRIELGDDRTIDVPMRIVARGSESDVRLTLFRQPGMTSERFAADEAWMRRDLEALKAWAEGRTDAAAPDRFP